MRKTKLDAYASYGIKAKKEKNSIYIYNPFFGWIRPVLINGNDKIGRGVWTYSMLATNEQFDINVGTKDAPDMIDIKGTCPCHCPGCYATKNCYNFSSTKKSLAIKTAIAYLDLDWLKRAILAQIEADHIKYLRIHAAGDFFSIEYRDMWKEIVETATDTIYWTYTKFEPAENAFDQYDNANIVKSLIPGIGLNYGTCEHVINAYNKLQEQGEPVYICRCGVDESQHCNTCKACSANKYVLFIEHSTSYDAAKDPRFDELKAIIESQPAANR